MGSLRRWDPESGAVATRGSSDAPWDWTNWPSLFDQFGSGPWMDVYETGGHVVVQVTLPGVDPNDIDVTVAGRTLTVQGEMLPDEQDKERRYVHRERRFGRFRRTVTLPSYAEGSRTEATYEQGVLILTIPKETKVRPRQIEVKAT